MEETVHNSAMSPAPGGFLGSRLGIAAFTLVISMAGGWLKDRLLIEDKGTASAIQIETLLKRVDVIERNDLPIAQFREYERATDARLDDIRDSLKQIDADLRAKQR